MSVNDVTRDRLVSAVPTEKYRSGWDAIDWGKPKEVVQGCVKCPVEGDCEYCADVFKLKETEWQAK